MARIFSPDERPRSSLVNLRARASPRGRACRSPSLRSHHPGGTRIHCWILHPSRARHRCPLGRKILVGIRGRGVRVIPHPCPPHRRFFKQQLGGFQLLLSSVRPHTGVECQVPRTSTLLYFQTEDRERGPAAWSVQEFHPRVRSAFWISFIPSRGRSLLVFVRRSPFSFCFASVFVVILLPERTGPSHEGSFEFRRARRSAFGIPFGDPVSRVARVIPCSLSPESTSSSGKIVLICREPRVSACKTFCLWDSLRRSSLPCRSRHPYVAYARDSTLIFGF